MTIPTLRRRLRAGLAAACCLLGAGQAAGGRDAGAAGLAWVPAPRSALVGRQDLQFRLAQRQREGAIETVLAYQGARGQARAVGVMALSGSGKARRVSVQRLPLPEAGDEHGDAHVATLEYLYTLVLRQDPEARFCFADIGQRCDAARTVDSHADTLRRIARARQHAVASAGRTAAIPWHAVSLAPAGAHPADPDEVAVRIGGESGPMDGVTIFFNRAPHSSCAAQSDAAGLAGCRLVDQHGDDDAHAGHDTAPVLAIFPGDLRTDRVLLPTTLLLPAP